MLRGECRTLTLVSSGSLPLYLIPNPISHYYLEVQAVEKAPLRTVECCRQNVFPRRRWGVSESDSEMCIVEIKKWNACWTCVFWTQLWSGFYWKQTCMFIPYTDSLFFWWNLLHSGPGSAAPSLLSHRPDQVSYAACTNKHAYIHTCMNAHLVCMTHMSDISQTAPISRVRVEGISIGLFFPLWYFHPQLFNSNP